MILLLIKYHTTPDLDQVSFNTNSTPFMIQEKYTSVTHMKDRQQLKSSLIIFLKLYFSKFLSDDITSKSCGCLS